MNEDTRYLCPQCGGNVDHRRVKLGYRLCLWCGEEAAKQVKHTVAPMHKSNYMLFTNPDDLKGINNKGGIIK
jgi:ribosomal protein L37AE/L43A